MSDFSRRTAAQADDARTLSPRRRVQLDSQKFAVLIDGSALFLNGANRGGEGSRLNYHTLIELLASKVPGLQMPGAVGSDSIWTMWTSAAPNNAGQMKFLDFAEQRLRWEVRTVTPRQSFVVEPELLFGIGTDEAKASRLVRFDAAIAFAMGRLAESHRLIVVSDSYALRDPIERVNEHWAKTHGGRCVLAFFGQGLDPRWRTGLGSELSPEHIDLDDHVLELFGIQQREEVQRPVRQPGHPIY